MKDELTWSDRFKRMKQHYKWSYEDIGNMLNCSADSVRNMVNRKERELSHPWKLAVLIFEKENGLTV
jgi:hypothetical protein